MRCVSDAETGYSRIVSEKLAQRFDTSRCPDRRHTLLLESGALCLAERIAWQLAKDERDEIMNSEGPANALCLLFMNELVTGAA